MTKDKLKNTESRLRNVMKDNATLKQRVEDVTLKLNDGIAMKSSPGLPKRKRFVVFFIFVDHFQKSLP